MSEPAGQRPVTAPRQRCICGSTPALHRLVGVALCGSCLPSWRRTLASIENLPGPSMGSTAEAAD